MSWDARKALRQNKAIPIIDEFEIWMKDILIEVLLQSDLGKATGYTVNLWTRLRAYNDNSRWEIDNKLVESSICPVALGRKNYMFAGSHEGAKHAAMMYSFFATCRSMT